MIAVLCVDDKLGMMFNHRRQSRDRVLQDDLIKLCGERQLYMNSNSYKIFNQNTEWQKKIKADDNFMEKAGDDDYCFIEDTDILPYYPKIKEVIFYKWNRVYPADVHFDFAPLEQNFICTETAEFSGSSHPKITRERYIRRI